MIIKKRRGFNPGASALLSTVEVLVPTAVAMMVMPPAMIMPMVIMMVIATSIMRFLDCASLFDVERMNRAG
jgi:hypothetical protein